MRIRIDSLCFVVTLALAASQTALAGSPEILPPVSTRFASAEITEEPSFQRHVSPLFGRLGCNGRSCHGSFQGRGDFRLSLFGYDFEADHKELLKGDPLRANKDKPHESLILVKPTDPDMHEGGLRYQKGGWEYHIFRRWLEAGAKFEEKSVQQIATLEVTPSEILFSTPGEKVTLKAVAVWPDGTREDVTCLCRFTSNSDQVATINADGLVTATDPGDTHVVVSYDSAVIAVPVIRPVSQLTGDRYPAVPTPTKIDELVVQKLKKLGVVPSDLCTDGEFLRRVSLDLTGTLPTAAEAEQFLNDPSPNKRAETLEQLLTTPAYAAWWTTRLCDFTGNNDTKFNALGTFQRNGAQVWYDWIYDRVAKNVPYDKLAEGIVTAVSRKPEESYTEYCSEMSKIYQQAEGATYANRPSLPLYWGRVGFRTAEERAIGFAYTFMGIRIQCAQCHKHPFDQWSKGDFDSFKNFFTKVNIVPYGAADKTGQEQYDQMIKDLGLADSGLRGNQLRNRLFQLLGDNKTVPFPDIAPQATRRGGNQPTSARVLGGEEIDLTKIEDSRLPLMDWLRSKDNPYFAKAFVNRVWANYFNVGIVEPPDDLSLANPPSNRALLEHLAQGFIESNFDMKWVHREICNSRTYQLSWQTNETNAKDEKNFARSVPRRLPAEVAVDALTAAISSDEKAASFAAKLEGRAIAVAGASARANQGANNRDSGFALQVFGRSIRESNCDCDRSTEASLLQTVYLQNDSTVLAALDGSKGSWIEQISKAAPQARPERNDVKDLDLPREIARLEARVAQAKEKGADEAAARFERRLGELKEAAKDKADAAANPGGLALDQAQLIRQAYLRTLTRLPTENEINRCQKHFAEAPTPVAAAKGLLWALVNTKEFIVNH